MKTLIYTCPGGKGQVPGDYCRYQVPSRTETERLDPLLQVVRGAAFEFAGGIILSEQDHQYVVIADEIGLRTWALRGQVGMEPNFEARRSPMPITQPP